MISQNIDLMTPNSAYSNSGSDVSCQHTHDIHIPCRPGQATPQVINSNLITWDQPDTVTSRGCTCHAPTWHQDILFIPATRSTITKQAFPIHNWSSAHLKPQCWLQSASQLGHHTLPTELHIASAQLITVNLTASDGLTKRAYITPMPNPGLINNLHKALNSPTSWFTLYIILNQNLINPRTFSETTKWCLLHMAWHLAFSDPTLLIHGTSAPTWSRSEPHQHVASRPNWGSRCHAPTWA